MGLGKKNAAGWSLGGAQQVQKKLGGKRSTTLWLVSVWVGVGSEAEQEGATMLWAAGDECHDHSLFQDL